MFSNRGHISFWTLAKRGFSDFKTLSMFWNFKNIFVTHIYLYVSFVLSSRIRAGGGRILILCSVKNQIYDLHKAGQSSFYNTILAAFPQVQVNDCRVHGVSNRMYGLSTVKKKSLEDYKVCKLERSGSGKCETQRNSRS